MIEVSHLHKRYGQVHAVRDLSFEVQAGAVVGFLGPNGAGKSTTLRIIAGFLGATAGTVRIGGLDILEHRLEALQNIGYMPETSPLYPEMRVGEYLRFRSELKRVKRRKRRAEVARVMEATEISDMARRPVGQLSKGYRQRVGLADALIGEPPLLILDEPTAGLDPNQIQQVRELIKGLSDNHTILVSTHILSEVEATCERAIIIHQGGLVAQGSLSELRDQRSGEVKLVVSTRQADTQRKQVRRLVSGVDGVSEASLQPAHADDSDHVVRLHLMLDQERDTALVREEVALALAADKIAIRHLAPVGASLEEVFSKLTQERA